VRFTLWDALFGTLYVLREPETLEVGLPDADPRDFTTVRKLYFLPFKKSVKEYIGLARKLLPAGLSQERIR
jgi:sterol desaturase/sphingolipid hydroxylase (fatty acid hydroxylase superfamily)